MELNNTEIQRSEVVQKVLQLYNYKEYPVKEEKVFPVEKKVYKKRNIEPLLLKHKMNTTITLHNDNSSNSDCALIPKPYVSKFYPKM